MLVLVVGLLWLGKKDALGTLLLLQSRLIKSWFFFCRNEEVIPEFVTKCCPPSDGVDIVFAVVSDESDIIFLTPNSTPVTHLS